MSGIKGANDSSWIAGDNSIVWHIPRYHRIGADNTVIPDGHALGDQRTIADPNVIFQYDGAMGTRRVNTMLQIMPVCISEIAIHGKHAAMARCDGVRGGNSDTGINNTIITDANTAQAFEHRQTYRFISQRHEMHMITNGDIGSGNLQMARINHPQVTTTDFKLRPTEAINVSLIQPVRNLF